MAAVRHLVAASALRIRPVRASGIVRAGDVETPFRKVLVELARALDRNPAPLLILAGHLRADEARALLEPSFRPAAELPEEWPESASISIDDAQHAIEGYHERCRPGLERRPGSAIAPGQRAPPAEQSA